MKQDKDDHRTPRDLFRGLDKLFGPFELDAAANDDNALCKDYFTMSRSAFNYPWEFPRVWLNPPYSKMAKWIKRVLDQLDEGHCEKVVMLIPVDTSASWWGKYIFERAEAIFFINKRLKFQGPNKFEDAVSPRASAVIVFTKRAFRDPNKFFGMMTTKGVILQPQKSLDEFLYK